MGSIDEASGHGSVPERPSAEQQFYLRSRGRITGPLTSSAIVKLVRRGGVSRLDEISIDRVSWTNIDPERILQLNTQASPAVASMSPPDRTIDCAVVESLPNDSRLEKSGSPDRLGAIKGQTSDLTKATYFWWGGAAGLALLIVIAIVCALIVDRTPGRSDRSAPRSSRADTQVTRSPTSLVVASTKPNEVMPIAAALRIVKVISSSKDESAMGEAVGLVVAGFEFATPQAYGGKTLQRPLVSGSCFTITSSGDAITNKHVVEVIEKANREPEFQELCRKELGAAMKPCIWAFFSGTKYTAEISYVSDKYDLAILKIHRSSPQFRLSTSSNLSRGQDVYALGFPGIAQSALSVDELKHQSIFDMDADPDVRSQFKDRDFLFTLTKGVLSRVVAEASGQRWIQHEAVVRHGNSGGPLVDADCVVVGVNTAVQRNGEGDVQTNMALDISQLRSEIESHVGGTIWRTPSAER